MVSNTSGAIVFSLLENYPERYNVNQIARMIGYSVGGVHRTLKALVKDKILISENVSNATLFQLNLTNDECLKIIELVSVRARENMFRTVGLSGLRKFKRGMMRTETDKLFAILVFESRHGSEVPYDVLIVTPEMNDNFVSNLTELSSDILQKEDMKRVSKTPILLTSNMFSQKAGRFFFNKLWEKGAVLYGESYILEEMKRAVR